MSESNMKLPALIVTTALALFSGTAAVHACGETPVMSTRLEDGTVIGLYLKDQQLERTPNWQPQKGEPPLSPSQAWDLVSKWGKEKLKRYDRIRIRSINLTRSGCWRSRGRWYYIVHYDPIIDGNSLYGGGNFAAVLMDGTVIGPQKRDQGSTGMPPFKGDRFFGRRPGQKL